jgi:hypothetical protein
MARAAPQLSFHHQLLCTSAHTRAGGETFIADAFAVARRLFGADPALFRALTRHPVTFSKVHFQRQYPASLHYRRPVIVVNQEHVTVPGTPASQPDVLSVNWSPQFEAPLHIDPSEAALFYEAYRCFEAMDCLFIDCFIIQQLSNVCSVSHQADVPVHVRGSATQAAPERGWQLPPLAH